MENKKIVELYLRSETFKRLHPRTYKRFWGEDKPICK